MNKYQLKITTHSPLIINRGEIAKISKLNFMHNSKIVKGKEVDSYLVYINNVGIFVNSRFLNNAKYDIFHDPYIYELTGALFKGKFAIKNMGRYIIFDTYSKAKQNVRDLRFLEQETIKLDIEKEHVESILYEKLEPTIDLLPFDGEKFYFPQVEITRLLVDYTDSKLNISHGCFIEKGITLFNRTKVLRSKDKNKVQSDFDKYQLEMGIKKNTDILFTIDQSTKDSLIYNFATINSKNKLLLEIYREICSNFLKIIKRQSEHYTQTIKHIEKKTYIDERKIKSVRKSKRFSQRLIDQFNTTLYQIDRVLSLELKQNQSLLLIGKYMNHQLSNKQLLNDYCIQIDQLLANGKVTDKNPSDLNTIFEKQKLIDEQLNIFEDIDIIHLIQNQLSGITVMEVENVPIQITNN